MEQCRQTAAPILLLAVVYGGHSSRPDQDLLQTVMRLGLPLFPVVSRNDLQIIQAELPKECQDYQCVFQDESNWRQRLVNGLLETFSLLRDKRKVFLSYKRDDSAAIAEQLFDALNRRGYDVFLDTAEVVPSTPFQIQLMHQLMDSDLLLLLDSPNLGQSEWVQKELQQAKEHGIGILRLRWPEVDESPNQDNSFMKSIDLTPSQRIATPGHTPREHRLDPLLVATLADAVEEMRAQGVGLRFLKLYGYCRDRARKWNLTPETLPNEIRLHAKTGSPRRLRVVTGRPESQNYHDLFLIMAKCSLSPENTALFYNGSGMDPRWRSHLDWLNHELPVRAVEQNSLDRWLRGTS
ncbi:MAG: toll/interleukin-1 receptor domain-containing protein [Magnetococcales bacterium]|nr:toll/interleukin-1 receptor domain-containing protein [Magnetococcales bacterium]